MKTNNQKECRVSERQRVNHEAALMPLPPYRGFFMEVTA